MLSFILFGSCTKLSLIVCWIFIRTVVSYGIQLVISYVFTSVSDIILIEQSGNLVSNKMFYSPVILTSLHNIDMRAADWSDRVAHLVIWWLNRIRFIVMGRLIGQFYMNVTHEYICWYKNNMRLDITRIRSCCGSSCLYLNTV